MIDNPISVAEARAIIANNVGIGQLTGAANADAATSERISRRAAPGRVLAEAIYADEDIPPFDNSAMDGYAVKARDLESVPTELRLQDEVRAGEAATGRLEPGACIRIMTGAPIPAGADAVVPVEWTAGWVSEGVVIVNRAPDAGQHVRRHGRDVASGKRVFEAGTVVTPPVVGMLAALGKDEIFVYRRPTVAVVATGDELVDDGSPLAAGQIRNSNGPGLVAQAEAAGADVLFHAVARDSEASIRESLTRGMEADLLLVSGGVSVGAYDYVRPVLESLHTDILFWRVRQRPGKPLAFGRTANTAVFGLPGNPVSSAICFEQYVRPTIRRFLGDASVQTLLRARLEEGVEKKSGLHYFARGIVGQADDGSLVARISGEQGSNIYSSMLLSNCMIHLPEASGDVPAGETVMVQPYSWAGGLVSTE